MFKKICFFIVVGFFALAIGYLQYNTYQVEYVNDLCKEHIKNNEFEEVAKMFIDCFDTKSIINDSTDEADIKIYPGMMSVNAYYTENHNAKAYVMYEPIYHMFIFNSKFEFNNLTLDDGKYQNKSSIRFNGDTKSYDYFLQVNSSYNEQCYVEEAKSLSDAVLNNGRTYVNSLDSLGFLTIDFSKTMLDLINKELGSNINSVSIISNEGTELYRMELTFNYDEQFFKDSDDLIKFQNDCLDKYEVATSDEERKNIVKSAQDELSSWISSNTGDDSTYFVRTESYSTPSSVIWKTVGSLVIFSIIVALIFILLFKRKLIKKLVFKITGRTIEEETKDISKKEKIMIGNVPAEDFEKFVIPEQTIEEKQEDNTEETKKI